MKKILLLLFTFLVYSDQLGSHDEKVYGQFLVNFDTVFIPNQTAMGATVTYRTPLTTKLSLDTSTSYAKDAGKVVYQMLPSFQLMRRFADSKNLASLVGGGLGYGYYTFNFHDGLRTEKYILEGIFAQGALEMQFFNSEPICATAVLRAAQPLVTKHGRIGILLRPAISVGLGFAY